MIAAALVVAVLTSPVGAQEPPSEPQAEQPADVYVPSFAESPGCGALDGVRGPLVAQAGHIPDGTAYYGPWADYFGRTKESVMGQLVEVRLPNMTYDKRLYVHERVLPAFELLLDNLADARADGRTYTVSSGQTWSLSYRTIGSSRHTSFHAWGAALDVNSLRNPYRDDNVLITDMPQWYVDAWIEAGWCWGGDWQTIKDPMHFSWRGPLHTPGYTTLAPQDPVVSAAGFTDEYDLGVMLPDDEAGFPEMVADMDRDGAADVVRIEPVGGSDQYILRTAISRHGHETCSAKPTAVSPTDPNAPSYLADVTGDARPDLIYALSDGESLAFEVFALEQSVALTPQIRTTGVAPAEADRYLFGDLDRDGNSDLFVIRAGDPARLEVWHGPGFTTRVTDVALSVPSDGHRFALGDLAIGGHFDGILDVYALDEAGVLTVHTSAARFAPEEPIATGGAGDEAFFVEDLDGDGHDDLLLTDENGSTRMLRGGRSTHDPGVWYEVTEDEWVPGSGCATPPPKCGGLVATVVGTPGADVLYGTDADNVIVAGDGNDTVWALGGDDIICAGRGRDFVFGGDGRDMIRGQQGPDWLDGGDGRDVIRGAGGGDTLVGARGGDRLVGGGGTDILRGGVGNDRLLGGSGVDEANGGTGRFDTCSAEREFACERAV